MSMVVMDSVCKAYNGSTVLDHLSLQIGAAERLVILGPSGCGKTTLLRLVAGFIAADSGSISIAGELVCRDGQLVKPPQQRGLGMVFQDHALWPHFSVRGNVEFGLKAHGVARVQRRRRVAAVLDRVGMAAYAARRPAELSGGQQQRVALARALVLEPQLLLMDEPLSSLDVDLNARLRGEILRLQQQLGFTLLYVTHNRDEAFAIASRMVVMSQGRIDFAGTTAQTRAYLESRS